ncbi:SixA phosphatase family protein [Ancylobacter amanitiformis]|uniref:Phosphohistidine phosphatase n=1 Tax=Ancylobacter amanitiformis TaxID=217069 RepID=A0ABU0LL35_9HYPH|nr:histidine phosphatase family protein [Ancylobacter amanitiformis]MDQ0509410.1 phosphohistidine phosphatase [Ancylobacter amanitiformis]
MLRLLLLRHAKSAWPEGVRDRDRPLAARGERGAAAMGAYMAEQGLIPAHALVSPARRTLETWDIATRHWPAHQPPAFEDAIYEASTDALLGVIRGQSARSPLLLLGHNPGLEGLAALLLKRAHRAKVLPKYPTGALAVIDLPVEDWSQVATGEGTLERFVTPRALGVAKD